MTEPIYTTSIHNLGFIPAVKNYSCKKKQSEKESSTEDYVGKITAIFSPYISNNISENKFIRLQDRVKSIVSEIKGER